MASMFTNAHKVHFSNSHFVANTTNFYSSPRQALNRLYDSIAPNAILNTGGRADEVRCHPGTRKKVIRRICKWRADIENNVTANQIFWLSGPAGAGKTAIVQTVAETWKALGIHTANFFFFRTDTSRNHAGSLISTLLYQIFNFVPAARDAVERLLELKPRLLDVGLEEQVDELVCNTFRLIQPPCPHKIVLLVDGLDECDPEAKISQTRILRVLDKLVHQEDLPFMVLVSSRADPHISATFKDVTSPPLSLFLNDKYSPEKDIRRFVTSELEKIKASHPLAASLKSHWPSNSDIEYIVKKSSGQYIYATTVVRFLAQSPAVPSLSLEKVQGIFPCAKNSPFVHLDSFYTYILQQADHEEVTRDLLASVVLDAITSYANRPSLVWSLVTASDQWRYTRHYLPPTIELLGLCDSRYTESLLISCISDISAIAHLREGRLRFHHSSLSDFLSDRSRSGVFHVEIGEFAAKIIPCIWNRSVSHYTEEFGPLGFKLLDFVQHSTPAVTKVLLNDSPSDSDKLCSYLTKKYFWNNISRLYYHHDIKSYKQILKRWVTWTVLTCDSDEDLQKLDRYCEPMTNKLNRWIGRHGGRDADDLNDLAFIPFLRQYVAAARIQKHIGRVAEVFRH